MNASFEIDTNENSESSYDFDSVKRIPLYFGTKEKPLFAWLHITDSKQHSHTGVVICPPLAVEYMNSYRSLRYTADYFALAGIPALRFDYHGTGDSSGIEEDENRLEEWFSSIHDAIAKLKELTDCTDIGLFGFRMGATLAALVAEKISVNFLVLWAAHTNGKKYIREIKLLQMTGKVQLEDNSLLEAGGMGYWEQTANDIIRIKLEDITPLANRVLVIPRDEETNSVKLYDAWKAKNINIEQQYHVGSTLMLVDAHLTVVPHKTIQKMIHWVKKDLDTRLITSKSKTIPDKYKANAIIHYSSKFCTGNNLVDSKIKESIIYYGKDNRAIGILSEPETSNTIHLPTIIISNSGANHRVGPSRLHVLIARELSLIGFRCIRIDIPGIGDSIIPNQQQENIEYIKSSSNIILEVINKFNDEYNNNQYIVMGLCSGAYFSFHAALELKNINIIESILINPLTFYWEEGMTVETSPTQNFRIWNWYKKALIDRDSWIKLLKGKIDYKSLMLAIKNRIETKLSSKFNYLRYTATIKNNDCHRKQLAIDLKKISDNEINIQFILAKSDPGYDILMTNAGKTVRKLQKNNKLKIRFIENADHTFSKYKPRCDLINTLIQHFKKAYISI